MEARKQGPGVLKCNKLLNKSTLNKNLIFDDISPNNENYVSPGDEPGDKVCAAPTFEPVFRSTASTKKQGWRCVSEIPALGNRDRMIPRACWPLRLIEAISFLFSESVSNKVKSQ